MPQKLKKKEKEGKNKDKTDLSDIFGIFKTGIGGQQAKRRIKSKKGVELGMNFVVILILSIVAFGFGLTFLYKIVNAGNSLPDFDPVEQVLNSRMASGEKVVVYPSSATLKSGQRDIFGVGVLNAEATQKTFTVSITSPTIPGDKIVKSSSLSFDLQNNEDRKISFVVESKGVAKGTHEITVDVAAGTSPYGAKKVYVTVT